jgi:hypothetical protein
VQCEVAQGTVVDFSIRADFGYRNYPVVSPLIVYQVNGIQYSFTANDHQHPPKGTVVPVLYKRSSPAVAYLYTFWSYWFHPILIVPIITWAAVVVGIGRNGSFWTFYWREFRVVRTEIQKRRFPD